MSARPVARVGDTVTGFCNGPGHDPGIPFTGTWTTSSSNTTAKGIQVIRVTDTGLTDCGHVFTAITGSSVVSAEGLAVHRVEDLVETEGGGVGSTTTGSDSVTSQ